MNIEIWQLIFLRNHCYYFLLICTIFLDFLFTDYRHDKNKDYNQIHSKFTRLLINSHLYYTFFRYPYVI